MAGDRLAAGLLLAVGLSIATLLLGPALRSTGDEAVSANGRAVAVAQTVGAPVELPVANTSLPPLGSRALVLHDPPTAAGDILEHDPELGGIFVANLAGHFGSVDTAVVDDYAVGDGTRYDGVIYVGAWGGPQGDNELPAAFLTDVALGAMPVLWLGAGADQLAEALPDFEDRFGWLPTSATASPNAVSYKAALLPREMASLPAHALEVTAPDAVTVLATTTEPQGDAQPYAVRSRNLTYVAEVPFGYLTEANHSLVVADLLFDLLSRDEPKRPMALVRLEDIGPTADPDDLRRAADALYGLDVPFAFAVYPVWRDPLGRYAEGDPVGLADRPELVEALRYLESKGGTMIMHGVTHQQGEGANPDSGVSGDDYEFYLVERGVDGALQPISPVPDDSVQRTRQRIGWGQAEFARAGLAPPAIFEVPHYLASPVTYEAIEPVFEARYERSTYFPGLLSGKAIPTDPRTQQFPYPVHDVYGEDVIPENLGSVTIDEGLDHRSWSQRDVVAAAERMTVVRNGVASFFIHPFLGVDELTEIVTGIEALGYDFVSVYELQEEWR